MQAPALGVPLMDEDHQTIERLFARVAETDDAGLPALLGTIADEIGAHFAREEALMTEARVPILHCHLELHAELLGELKRMRATLASLDAASARRMVGSVLPRLVENHVTTADTASASFLR